MPSADILSGSLRSIWYPAEPGTLRTLHPIFETTDADGNRSQSGHVPLGETLHELFPEDAEASRAVMSPETFEFTDSLSIVLKITWQAEVRAGSLA